MVHIEKHNYIDALTGADIQGLGVVLYFSEILHLTKCYALMLTHAL